MKCSLLIGLGMLLIVPLEGAFLVSEALAQGPLEGRVQWDAQSDRYYESEQVLNNTYQVLQKVLDPLSVQKLDLAQKAWEQFRESECDFKINHSAESPIHPVTYNECVIVMNLERAVDLQSEIQWQLMVNPFPFSDGR